MVYINNALKGDKKVQIKTFNSYHPEHTKLYEDILTLTMSVNDTYSGYTDWYKNVFLPGLKKGERMYVVAQDENENLAGCVLIKNTNDEKKICTLFVNQSFRKQGLATLLMEVSLKELGEHPLITVSSKNIFQLKPLLDKMGFHLSDKRKGAYGAEDTEFYFNDKKVDLIKNRMVPVLPQRMKNLSR